MEERTEILGDPRPLAAADEDAPGIQPPELPQAIGRYAIVGLVGQGGMGTVYRAHDPQLDREVALKVLGTGTLRPSPDLLARFEREARLAARLRHPNLIPVHDVGRSPEGPYYTMDLVEGPNLAERLEASPPLADRRLVEIVRDIAGAVGEAHAAGLVHRDIKPENILLAAGQTPYLTDFGLAREAELDASRLTRSGTVLGTAHFMAPEQAQGRTQIGPPADVWALGVTLYDGLTAELPFDADALADLLARVIHEDPLPPSHHRRLDADLETIVLCCLEKDPARRYADGRALAADLQRLLDGQGVAARRAGRLYRGVRWVRRNRVLAGVLLLVAAVLLVAGGLLLRSWRRQADLERASRHADQQRLTERVEAAERQQALAKRQVALEQERAAGARRELLQAKLSQKLWISAVELLDLYRRRLRTVAAMLIRDRRLKLFGPIKALLREHPDHPQALWMHGLGLVLQGKQQEGLQQIGRSLQLDPRAKLPRLLRALIQLETLYMGEVHGKQRHPRRKDLLASIREDVNATSQGELHLLGEPYYHLARAAYYYLTGKYRQADQELRRVYSSAPSLPEFWLIQGLNQLNGLRQPDKAAQSFRSAMALGVVDGALFRRLAEAYQQAGNQAAANVFWQVARTMGVEDPTQALERAQELRRKGELERALAAVNLVLARNPRNVRAILQRGLIYQQQGKHELARADFDKAIEIDPKIAESWNTRGTFRAERGDYAGAVADFSAALERKPTLYEALVNRGIHRQRLRQFDAAGLDLDRAIALAPGRGEAYNARAALHMMHQRWDPAKADGRKAVALLPRHGGAHYTLGFVCVLRKEWPEAVEHLQLAVKLDPNIAPTAAKWLWLAQRKVQGK